MNNPLDPKRRAALRVSLVLGTVATLLSSRAGAQGRRRTTERPPLANSPQEQRVLAVLDEVYRNHRYLSVPEEDGRLLRLLAESMDARHVVEIGTSTGYSGLWILLALMKTGGRLTTFEVDRARLELAGQNFDRAGLLRQATLVLGDAHVQATKLKDPIDLLFIDADKDGYLDYLQKLGPLVRPAGLIVAHNMASPPPDPRYVEAVTTDPALETVFLNMHRAGIGMTLKKH